MHPAVVYRPNAVKSREVEHKPKEDGNKRVNGEKESYELSETAFFRFQRVAIHAFAVPFPAFFFLQCRRIFSEPTFPASDKKVPHPSKRERGTSLSLPKYYNIL